MKQFAVMLLSVYKAICDKVREFLSITDLIKADELPEKINEVYEAGKKAEWNAFWDTLQDNGTRTDYGYTFFGEEWNDEIFKPKYKIKHKGQMISTFRESGITKLDMSVLDTTEVTVFTTTFQSANNLESVEIDIPLCTGTANAFYYLPSLKTLIFHNLREDCGMGSFINCTALENFVIDGIIGQGVSLSSCPLTHESLINIINVLKDYSKDTSGTLYTITLGGKNLAKLTEDELLQIERKGWRYA